MTFIFLALALQAAPAPNPEIQRDIVVIGNKMKAFRTSVRERDGKMVCATKTSTGNGEIDAIGCNVLAGCLTEHRPRLDASTDRKRPAAERKRLREAVERDLLPCMMTRRDALIADLAERRWQARQGAN